MWLHITPRHLPNPNAAKRPHRHQLPFAIPVEQTSLRINGLVDAYVDQVNRPSAGVGHVLCHGHIFTLVKVLGLGGYGRLAASPDLWEASRWALSALDKSGQICCAQIAADQACPVKREYGGAVQKVAIEVRRTHHEHHRNRDGDPPALSLLEFEQLPVE